MMLLSEMDFQVARATIKDITVSCMYCTRCT